MKNRGLALGSAVIMMVMVILGEPEFLGGNKETKRIERWKQKQQIILRQEEKVRIINPDKKLVALTFDDGPSENTEIILRILKKYNSTATFFVIGNRVDLFESTVKEAVDMGCEIGNHTYEHKVLTELNAEQIWLQIYKTNEAVKRVTGTEPVLMRPPCGFDNGNTNRLIAMPLILWSVDTKDWETQNSYSTVDKVLKNIEDGDIILMHDLYEATAEAIKTIVPSLIAEGYQLVTVSEMAESRGIEMEEGKEYRKLNEGTVNK